MCGIIGMVSKKEFFVKEDLLKALKRLEYRGYDSVGYVDVAGNTETSVGYIDDFLKKIKERKTGMAIAHTRWSTHGGITEDNAHPHFNEDKTLFIVHNGIIENFQELKGRLEQSGHTFSSETDSEVIVHYFEEKLKEMPEKQAIMEFMNDAKGTYAILMMAKDSKKMYAIKKDSPLVLGISKDTLYLASDIYAFSNKTNKAIFFEDKEFAIVNLDFSYEIYDSEGKKIKKPVTEFKWKEAAQANGKFRHFMIKEIHEEPAAAEFLLNSLEHSQKNNVDRVISMIREAKKVAFVSCGTSYHASIFGEHLLKSAGIDAVKFIGSEFEEAGIDRKTLIIAVSQSGETMDLVKALKKAKASGAKIVSIVNVPYSTIQRMSDVSLEICAGQEVCVAATKTFINQVILLMYLAKKLGHGEQDIELDKIPEKIAETMKKNETKASLLAKKISHNRDIYVLGRKTNYAASMEIALKIKEITYIHAEGMMAGELKHGTLALIEKGIPVISLIPNNNSQMISNTKEVEARGAMTISIINSKTDYKANFEFAVPKSSDIEFGLYSVVIGQLLTYYIGLEKKLPIDKPRNLAKSVTVE